MLSQELKKRIFKAALCLYRRLVCAREEHPASTCAALSATFPHNLYGTSPSEEVFVFSLLSSSWSWSSLVFHKFLQERRLSSLGSSYAWWGHYHWGFESREGKMEPCLFFFCLFVCFSQKTNKHETHRLTDRQSSIIRTDKPIKINHQMISS